MSGSGDASVPPDASPVGGTPGGRAAGEFGAYAVFDRAGTDRSGQDAAFDAIGDRYDEAFPHKEGQLAAGTWLLEQLPAAAHVLDLACGTGMPTARQLADAGMKVTGIDLSHRMIELARSNVPEGDFRRLDIADLEEAGLGPFDGAAAFFALLMLPRAEIPVALRMLHGRLRPGAPLALSMVEADVDDFSIPFLGNTIRVSGYLREDLHQVVTDAGFEIAGEDSYAYAPASTDVPPEIQIFLHCRRRP